MCEYSIKYNKLIQQKSLSCMVSFHFLFSEGTMCANILNSIRFAYGVSILLSIYPTTSFKIFLSLLNSYEIKISWYSRFFWGTFVRRVHPGCKYWPYVLSLVILAFSINRGFSGEHNIFVKPEIRLKPSPLNTKIFWIPN